MLMLSVTLYTFQQIGKGHMTSRRSFEDQIRLEEKEAERNGHWLKKHSTESSRLCHPNPRQWYPWILSSHYQVACSVASPKLFQGYCQQARASLKASSECLKQVKQCVYSLVALPSPF